MSSNDSSSSEGRSQAAAMLGAAGKGRKKMISAEERERRRARMAEMNRARATRKPMDRAMMIGLVAEIIPQRSVNDLPMIRQAINDTADAYRKEGWSVRDWAQDSVVEAVQARVAARVASRVGEGGVV